MKTFKLEIYMDGDAFREDGTAELADLVRDAATQIMMGDRDYVIVDSLGNNCGRFEIDEDAI